MQKQNVHIYYSKIHNIKNTHGYNISSFLHCEMAIHVCMICYLVLSNIAHIKFIMQHFRPPKGQ